MAVVHFFILPHGSTEYGAPGVSSGIWGDESHWEDRPYRDAVFDRHWIEQENAPERGSSATSARSDTLGDRGRRHFGLDRLELASYLVSYSNAY